MSAIEIAVLVLSCVDALCCASCRIPQIVRIIRLKESNAISLPFWICNIASCFMCITCYALQLSIGNVSMVIFLCSATLNLILNFVTAILTKHYRKN